jgi:Prealbumin-like fold domain
MTERILGESRSPKRRRRVFVLLALVTVAFAVFVAASGAVLPGSPSNFESGNDPTLGLGNMVVDTPGNNDWATVNFDLVQDGTGGTDNSYDPGQDFDVNCPNIVGHNNPPKDDFSHVASFSEKNATTDETYLYGATIRFAPNGNASQNLELKQGPDLCPGSTTLLARKAGDKLLAIDYLGGGNDVDFHVLTWVTSGACFINNHSSANGCWGADVLELDPTQAEGGVNATDITAANNPISDADIRAGQFAEFGVNLAEAGILPPGSCESINQIVWLSRSAGSSFGSQPKDVAVEDVSINVCASLSVHKVGSDGGSQEGAVFTLYEGADTTGAVVGTCTVDAAGDCLPVFEDLNPGTYTIDETTVPAGYSKDPTLPFTFVLAENEEKILNFTDPALEGALIILKNSTKGGAVSQGGAVFSYDSASVTDNDTATGDEDAAAGSVCVSGLDPGVYTVNETSPPPGYGAADPLEADQMVTVVNGTNCTDNRPVVGAIATFTNPPLSDIQVNFRDGGSGETSATITCDNTTGTSDTTPATDWDTSETIEDIEAPTVITCVIDIDP